MGKVCTSCGGDIAMPQLPEEEDELCDNCASDDVDDDMSGDMMDEDDDEDSDDDM